MKHSAGIAIIIGDKLLMGHPSGNKWYRTYSIPKGIVDKGEDILAAAIRETEEEVGIKIKASQLTKGPFQFVYPSRKKKLTFWIADIKSVKDIGMSSEIVHKSVFKPNKEGILEIDWAGFITFKEARKRASNPMQKLLDMLDTIYKTSESTTFKNYQQFNGL